MDEEVDLEPDKRAYFDETYASLERLTHYELLTVPLDADKKTIKRAYFRLAATVHPDRHFKKKLGSYKQKMEVLFARITSAFEVLSDRDKREEYDAELPASVRQALAAAPPAAPESAPATPRAQAKATAASGPAPSTPGEPQGVDKRKQAMDALKARFEAGKAKVKPLLDAAQRARAAQDLASAAESYRQALVYAPDDDEIGAAYAEVQKAVADRLVDGFVKKAELEERFGQWTQAAESWRRVTLARPEDRAARQRLEDALARAARG